MKRSTVRRIALVVAVLAVLAIGVVGVLILNLDWIARHYVVATLERQTGTRVGLDAVTVGLRTPTFRLQGLVISNPPGFGPEPILDLPELFVEFDREAAATNVLRLREARVHLGGVHLAIDAEGRTNLTRISKSATESRGGGTNWLGGLEFGGIERLTLTLGTVALTDERPPGRRIRLDLGITNRSFTNVTSVVQLVPLALEIVLKGGGELAPLLSVPR